MKQEEWLLMFWKALQNNISNRTIDTDCVPEVNDMWTIHSYEGDYNPLHESWCSNYQLVYLVLYI